MTNGQHPVGLNCQRCAFNLSVDADQLAHARATLVKFFQEHEDCRTHIDLAGAVVRALLAQHDSL